MLLCCYQPFISWPSCPRPSPLAPPAGGHNVIIGLHDYLQRWHPGSTLVGFLGGPAGVMNSRYKVLTADELVRGAEVGWAGWEKLHAMEGLPTASHSNSSYLLLSTQRCRTATATRAAST